MGGEGGVVVGCWSMAALNFLSFASVFSCCEQLGRNLLFIACGIKKGKQKTICYFPMKSEPWESRLVVYARFNYDISSWGLGFRRSETLNVLL